MKLRDVLQGVEIISAEVDMDMEIDGVECDSRAVSENGLFVAVRGFETDGNKYIADALSNGATAVITDSKKYATKSRIYVADARRALAECAKNFYGNPTRDMKVIGVTGTNGKTTVTYLIKHCLERAGKKCGLIGTNQNMIGNEVLPTERTTPESNALWKLFAKMRDAGCEYVIMEVSSHSLELARVHGIEFFVGAFTNLTQDHLDFHKTMENYEKAKAKLFDVSRVGVINYDDAAGQRIAAGAKCPTVTYSTKSSSASYVAKSINYSSDSVSFAFVGIDMINRVELGIPGDFSVCNAMCAAGVLIECGLKIGDICAYLSECSGVKGRAEVVPTNTDYTVMIDYAHSPDGLENILTTVKKTCEGRVITVFGCGGDRDRTKRPIMGGVVARLSDVVIVTSDNPRCEDPEKIIDDIIPGIVDVREDYIRIADRREAIGKALEIAEKGDVVLLAGKGHETYQEIQHVKHHMDEREIVKEYLSGDGK